MTAAVVPFAGDLQTSYGNVNMAVANLSVGPLWMFAISSLSVYGLVLAGWSSNSKFPFLGGVRSSAQMISYEISMGLSIIPVLMIYSTLDLSNIVEYQAANGWLLLPVWSEGLSWQRWILLVPVAISFIIFLTSILRKPTARPLTCPNVKRTSWAATIRNTPP